MRRVLVSRTDGLGDVLLAGPAIRAIAASLAHVTLLIGPAGAPAAHRLPGVHDVIVERLPWIDAEPEAVTPPHFDALVGQLRARCFDEAILLTSFHQSALPLALTCRLAGIPRVAAISDDYPGSLLDVRHHVSDGIHEVQRNLSLAAAAGYVLPSDDDGRLALTIPTGDGPESVPGRYIVVHPGASVPARTLAPSDWRAIVAVLARTEYTVAVTGSADDAGLTRLVTERMPANVVDYGGRTDFDAMSRLIAGAKAIVVGNTGPAHVAAAVGTPVASIYAPTVPAYRWRPWKVPHVLLGDQHVACRGCRARVCPLPVQRCFRSVRPEGVLAAVSALVEERSAVA
jgi:ADP-heptose:LPS heptosyltransferase